MEGELKFLPSYPLPCSASLYPNRPLWLALGGVLTSKTGRYRYPHP
jgi:hypothetical protein